MMWKEEPCPRGACLYFVQAWSQITGNLNWDESSFSYLFLSLSLRMNPPLLVFASLSFYENFILKTIVKKTQNLPRKCSIQWASFVCCLSSLSWAGPAGASRGQCPRPLSLSLDPRGRALTMMRPLPPVHRHRPLGHHVPALFRHLRGQRGSSEVIHAVGVLKGAYDSVSATYCSLKNCFCDLFCSNFCVSWKD